MIIQLMTVFVFNFLISLPVTSLTTWLGYTPGSWWFVAGVPFLFACFVTWVAYTVETTSFYFNCQAWQNRLPPMGGLLDLPSFFYRRSAQISRDDAETHLRMWEHENRELKPEEREPLRDKIEIADSIRSVVRQGQPRADRFERNAYGVTKQEFEDALANRLDDLSPWRLMQILCALGVGIEIRVKEPDEESYHRIHFDMRELRRSQGYPHGTYNERD